MGKLEGKVAIVTGAGRDKGLGEAIARRLAEDGAKIVISDIGEVRGKIAPEHGVGKVSEMEDVAAKMRADGADVATKTCDVLKESDVEDLVNFANDTYGSVDILVNNAGIGYLFGPLLETTQEEWDAVLGVNLRGVFFGIKHAARKMIDQGRGGRIINIGSQASKSAFKFTSAYTSSKHGLLGLTRNAALELAEHGITVNLVCPNHVTTGLGSWQNSFLAESRGLSVEEYLEQLKQRIPMGRVGLPEDTANACAFLALDESVYITGDSINVSGGEEYH